MRFRVSALAREDVIRILAVSAERWGEDTQARYANLLDATFRAIAADPHGPLTRERDELFRGLRSLHTGHAGVRSERVVRSPVHVVYYRIMGLDLIEIARILHERMEPSRYFDAERDG